MHEVVHARAAGCAWANAQGRSVCPEPKVASAVGRPARRREGGGRVSCVRGVSSEGDVSEAVSGAQCVRSVDAGRTA